MPNTRKAERSVFGQLEQLQKSAREDPRPAFARIGVMIEKRIGMYVSIM
jgi:hypothetical protein